MSNFFYGLICFLMMMGVMWFAIRAWDAESDAREARVAKIVEQMKGESK